MANDARGQDWLSRYSKRVEARAAASDAGTKDGGDKTKTEEDKQTGDRRQAEGGRDVEEATEMLSDDGEQAKKAEEEEARGSETDRSEMIDEGVKDEGREPRGHGAGRGDRKQQLDAMRARTMGSRRETKRGGKRHRRGRCHGISRWRL